MWHHGMAGASFPTHLHSFDGPFLIEEQQPSLETPTRQTNDRPKFFAVFVPCFKTIVVTVEEHLQSKQPFFHRDFQCVHQD